MSNSQSSRNETTIRSLSFFDKFTRNNKHSIELNSKYQDSGNITQRYSVNKSSRVTHISQISQISQSISGNRDCGMLPNKLVLDSNGIQR